MAKLQWDKDGERYYETGVSQGTLYVKDGTGYKTGVAWNGLTAVTESPSGAESTPLYADNIKYLNLLSAEEFGATVEAYTYPDEFGECDGSAELITGVSIGQQGRKSFGLAYKTLLGNDASGTDYGYKLHIIYGAQAAPSEKAYATVNDSPEAITFSWELTTTPVNVAGHKPTANITIDSTKADKAKLKALEDILFGSESSDPRLPLPDEIATIFNKGTTINPITAESNPTSGNSTLAKTGPIKITFNNVVNKYSVTLMKAADGTVAQVNSALDSTKKILTITPKSALEASTKYFLSISNVSDIYGQSLETKVFNYTTVA